MEKTFDKKNNTIVIMRWRCGGTSDTSCKYVRIVSLVLIAAFLILPMSVTAADLDEGNIFTRIFSPEPQSQSHYGYITIDEIQISLQGTDAEITMSYEIDPWIAFLVFLLGKQDLKERLLQIIQYPDPIARPEQHAEFMYVDNEKAVISVTNVSLDYNDGTYWYPAHTFSVEIPTLRIVTPQADNMRTYNYITTMEKGFGYFRN